MNEVTHYKVWIHVEGLDDVGDCVEGDDYHEPVEAGVCATLEEAEHLRATLIEAAGQ